MARTKQTRRWSTQTVKAVLKPEVKKPDDDEGTSKKDHDVETSSESKMPRKAVVQAVDIYPVVDEIIAKLGPSAGYDVDEVMDQLQESFGADAADLQATKKDVAAYINDKFMSGRESKRSKTADVPAEQ